MSFSNEPPMLQEKLNSGKDPCLGCVCLNYYVTILIIYTEGLTIDGWSDKKYLSRSSLFPETIGLNAYISNELLIVAHVVASPCHES